jgi:VRR-NUC domain
VTGYLRAGWPDFLAWRKGKIIGVEVKSPGDEIRPSQRRMFRAFGKAGIHVFVWDPRDPERLTPWEKFQVW